MSNHPTPTEAGTANTPPAQDTDNNTPPVPAPARDTTPDTGDDGTGNGDRPGREAARYRRRLRDTEAERDRLAQQLETSQRREVESAIRGELAKPEALWSTGRTITDMLDDDGAVDPSKAIAAAQHARDELGLQRPRSNYVPREGNTPQVKTTPQDAMLNVVMGRDQ